MEDSHEIHSEDDKGHVGKLKARIMKTPAQLEGLEKFYQEHKYPTESMKLEVAQSLGLTEKQVSGWFCHRRLKDKRLSSRETNAKGRQDRSSGVIQDRGSGFRQDSCGSTKQGDDKYFDHREVESRRLTGPEVSTADVTREADTRYRAESNLMEDTPSGSSSSLRDARFSQNVESFDMATSRYLPGNEPTDLKCVKPRTGPSGYLKVKAKVENASITAVKRQLGSLYRQDGPLLGVVFDQLPQCAFESSVQTPVDDPIYSGEPVPDLTPDFTKVDKRSNSCIGYGSISKINSHGSDLDGANFKKSNKSSHPEYYINQKPDRNSSMHNGDRYYLGRSSSIEMRKDSGERYCSNDNLRKEDDYAIQMFGSDEELSSQIPTQVQTLVEGSGSVLVSEYKPVPDVDYLQELLAIQQQGPRNIGFFGTRNMGFMHQELIEILATPWSLRKITSLLLEQQAPMLLS